VLHAHVRYTVGSPAYTTAVKVYRLRTLDASAPSSPKIGEGKGMIKKYCSWIICRGKEGGSLALHLPSTALMYHTDGKTNLEAHPNAIRSTEDTERSHSTKPDAYMHAIIFPQHAFQQACPCSEYLLENR